MHTFNSPTPRGRLHRAPRPCPLGDGRPVLVLLDGAGGSAARRLARGVEAAVALDTSLRVVVLHPRLRFTTNAAVAARAVDQLTGTRNTVASALDDLLNAQQRRLPYQVWLAPYARRPFGDPTGQARKAARRWVTEARIAIAEPSLISAGDRSRS